MNTSGKLKSLLIGASIINLFALTWFTLGSTANFNRGIDLVTTILFLMIGIPSFFMLIISISLIILVKNENLADWKRTDDRQFKYCIELVNLFQKNSSARLYLKNLQSADELYISLDLPVRDIGGLMPDKYFSHLEPTADSNIYKLVTTNESPFPKIEFEIHIKEKTAIGISSK